MEINGAVLRILKECYIDNVAYIRIGKELLEPIKVIKGLRQGFNLSPILFNIHLEKIVVHWKKHCQGMGLPIEEYMCCFLLTMLMIKL